MLIIVPPSESKRAPVAAGAPVAIAKRVRGEAARVLLESGADPPDPHALADLLADRWAVRLEAPERAGKAWTMTLSID